jgi:hypothetical protein
MACLIKTIPADILAADKYGNKGLGFPLTVPCGTMVAEAAQECYLALETDNDGGFGSPLMQEFVGLMGIGQFAAPCIGTDFLCYLAKEEDGFTEIIVEEPSGDYFAVPCI